MKRFITEDNNVCEVSSNYKISVNELIETLNNYRDYDISVCGAGKFALFCNTKDKLILADDTKYMIDSIDDIICMIDDNDETFNEFWYEG